MSVLKALVEKIVNELTQKKKGFTSYDIWMHLRLATDKFAGNPDAIVKELFFEGSFPKGYIAQIIEGNTVLYRYSRYAKEFKYSGLTSKQKKEGHEE